MTPEELERFAILQLKVTQLTNLIREVIEMEDYVDPDGLFRGLIGIRLRAVMPISSTPDITVRDAERWAFCRRMVATQNMQIIELLEAATFADPERGPTGDELDALIDDVQTKIDAKL